MRIIFSLLITFLVFVSEMFPQQFRFRHLTTNEGLSQNSVHTIHQDKEGFLWFGTQDGVNRFDGISFKIFKHSNRDSTSISDNYILCIAEDSCGNLWFGTRNGANRFDKKTETFHRYYFPDLFDFSFHQNIQVIVVDRDGNVLMMLPGVLYSFSPTDTFATPTLMTSFSNENYGIQILQDAKKNFWITLASGIVCLNSAREKHFFPFPKPMLSGGFIVARNDHLLISAEEKLLSFSLLSKTFSSVPLENESKNFLSSLFVDSHKRIWATTGRKIFLLSEISPSQFQQTIIMRNENDKFSLSDETAQCVFEDNAGLFWFGTMHGGVNVYDPLQSQFKTIDESLLKTFPTVWAICEDSRKIFWFGTSGGLVKAVRRDTSNLVTSYHSFEDAFRSLEIIPRNELSHQITAIAEDDEHQLWLGMGGNGVIRYHVEQNTFQHFVHSEKDTNSLTSNSVLSIKKISDGSIWVCTFNGISVFEQHRKSFRNLYVKNYDSSMVNYTLSIYEDAENNIWIVTSSGVARYNVRNNSMKIFRHQENAREGLSYNIVTSCLEDDNNNLWIATLGGGVNVYNKKNETMEYFSSEDGLSNDVVYGICRGKKNILWFSTNDGLSRFHTETKTFTNFGMEEGLRLKEFALNSFFQNASGEIFFGGVGGVVAFHSDSVEENTFVPPIVLSDLKINYKSVGEMSSSLVRGSFTIPEEIHLSYLEKTLTLQFVALNFRNAERNQYQYKLEGFDDNWIVPERNSRIAHYTSLPSGEFTFIVKASNNSGVWNNEGLRIKIMVFPPFWESWWFRSLMSVVIIGTVVYSVRSYSNRNLRKKLQALEMHQKIQTERERISRDLHDNVGSQLVNIISGLDIANRFSETSKEKTRTLLSSLKEDARTSMALLRQTIWALKTNALTLEQFSVELEHYVQKQCSYHEEIAFHSEKKFSQTIILTPIQVLNLFRITQEAITNTLKYANAKNIFLLLSLSEQNELLLSIQDDGIGFQENVSEMFGGNGLMNMERRAKELGGTFRCVNEKGITVEITLPL
jgi:signal transduction histidine kinase/ligand-binding sensor domain-containing protein